MDYMKIIQQMTGNREVSGNNYLCSGSDMTIAKKVLNDIFKFCDGSAILVDDSGIMKDEMYAYLNYYNYRIYDAFSSDVCLADILNINSIIEISKIRSVLTIAGFSEIQKHKIVSYLSFIRQVEMLNNSQGSLTLEVLSQYSTNMNVENRLQNLKALGIISYEEQIFLLSKYAELSALAADFEYMLSTIGSFITGNVMVFDILKFQRNILYIPLYLFGRDLNMKRVVIELLNLPLNESNNNCRDIVIFDSGIQDDEYLSDMIQNMQHLKKSVYVISQDIFTSDNRLQQIVFKNMDVKIFSKHNNMDSCKALEGFLGDIDVIKQTYTVDYPRQWKANSAFDILFGCNKTEHYGWNAPVREPKYRKEYIHSFPIGVGIVEYKGNSSLFNVVEKINAL